MVFVRDDQEVRAEVEDQYQLDMKVGEGAYGEVWKARSKLGDSLVALKRVRVESEDDFLPTTAAREISILKELQHPNIVSLMDVFYRNNKSLYLVFEFVEMDLKKFMTRQPDAFHQPNRQKRVLYQILRGVDYIHKRRILHRDLKPQNILVDGQHGKIKLADFGLARPIMLPVRAYTHEVVTLWYRAPEILLNASVYSTAVDMWSVGCIFAEMCNDGEPIFQGETEIAQLFKIFEIMGTPTEETWPGVSNLNTMIDEFPQWRRKDLRRKLKHMDDQGWDLLCKMLQYRPSQRISSEDALKHEYFSGMDGLGFQC